MTKTEALQALGGTVTSAAQHIGISRSAVSQWPEQLPKTAIHRVQAALWRRHLAAEAAKQAGTDQPPAVDQAGPDGQTQPTHAG